MVASDRSRASKRTMKFIASQLKELSKTIPLRKITVNDIADFCEINRSTFYYHFIDKQDAINYVYHIEVTEPLRRRITAADSDGHADNLSLYSLQLMYKSRDFYSQAFRIHGQNDIQSYILSEVRENWQMICRNFIKQSGLNGSVNMRDVYYLSDYFAYGAFSMMKNWVLDGMEDSVDRIGALLDTAGSMMLQAFTNMMSGD